MVGQETSQRNPLRATAFNPELRRKTAGQWQPAIAVRRVDHFYGDGEQRKQVLFDNNLVIYPGEIIIMTGPSGSGKTTLLTLLGTLRRVQHGELEVLDEPLHGATDSQLRQLRQRLGFIFQAHNLFGSLTATQNVRMALELVEPDLPRAEATKRAQEMLALVGLGARLNHKPKQLSGGQKQRVAIARGLVHRPRLVLADEPTAALDEQSGRTVVEMFRDLAQREQVTIIIVTHDNRILDVADRIVNLVDGRIVSDVLVKEASIIGQMLASCSVFDGVTPRTLTEVADKMQVETWSAGQRIIREGDLGDKFYLIREGRVAVRRGASETAIAELKEGDFFGEAALITGQPRNAHIDALEDTVLYSLSKEHFQKAMQDRATLEDEVRSSLFDRG
jgi:putative ABC transport system ATP-binding protein